MGSNLRTYLLPAETAALDLSPEQLRYGIEFAVLARGNGWCDCQLVYSASGFKARVLDQMYPITCEGGLPCS